MCLKNWLLFAFLLAFSLPASAQDGTGVNMNTNDLLTDSIDNLLTVEIELNNLNRQIELLSGLLTTSQGDLTALKASLKKYQDRVAQLSKRYEQLLAICSDLKKSLQASNLTWQIGIPTALAVGIVGTLILVRR